MQDINPADLFPPVQYRIAEDDDVDMPYKVPDSDGKGSPGELQNIQAARRALKRFRSDLGSKRGADAVRVGSPPSRICWMSCLGLSPSQLASSVLIRKLAAAAA